MSPHYIKPLEYGVVMWHSSTWTLSLPLIQAHIRSGQKYSFVMLTQLQRPCQRAIPSNKKSQTYTASGFLQNRGLFVIAHIIHGKLIQRNVCRNYISGDKKAGKSSDMQRLGITWSQVVVHPMGAVSLISSWQCAYQSPGAPLPCAF